ncbi:MAG TPA: HIT family protein [Opitutaceae bacterium]|nr:HIT family protein [Opitutaceae bacterium]
MSDLPDCQYCRKDQRLHDLMIEVGTLSVSTVYLFKEQTHPGRCVVAYQHHVNELFEVPDRNLTLFMQDVAKVARVIKTVFAPDKINYGAYSDKLPHLHMHVVPKYRDAAQWGAPFEMMPAARTTVSPEVYQQRVSALRAGLGL